MIRTVNNQFTATIYKYFEPGVQIKEVIEGKEVLTDNFTFACKFCKTKKLTKPDGSVFTVKASKKTASNLTAHLRKQGHEDAYNAYMLETKTNTTQSTKRRLVLENSPLNSLHKFIFLYFYLVYNVAN